MTRDSTALTHALVAYRSALKQHAPQLAAQLRKGLKPEDIEAALREWERTQEWSFPLPSEVFVLFAVFNGQKSLKAALLPNAGPDLPGLALGSIDLMNQWRNNAAGMIHLAKGLEWYRSLTLDDTMRREFWNDHWFPFAMGEIVTAQESVQVTALLDFAPSASGRAGQVALHIERTEQFRVHLERRVIAPSLAAYLEGVVTDIDTGHTVPDALKGLRRAE